ncbi:hypothetical protein, partial [Klebsiella oxytoca]|uniref:hypothetical protein n=1 Tax=Klebsiella oxytoca TaxID=571 RepID=UPI001CCED772
IVFNVLIFDLCKMTTLSFFVDSSLGDGDRKEREITESDHQSFDGFYSSRRQELPENGYVK